MSRSPEKVHLFIHEEDSSLTYSSSGQEQILNFKNSSSLSILTTPQSSLKKHSMMLKKTLANFLTLYLLTKVHKQFQRIPKGRPIIATCGPNTERISWFLDSMAKESVKNLESYIEDTPDILKK